MQAGRRAGAERKVSPQKSGGRLRALQIFDWESCGSSSELQPIAPTFDKTNKELPKAHVDGDRIVGLTYAHLRATDNMSALARSTAGRSVYLKVQPRPRSITDTKRVLEVLRKYGEVEMFKHLKVRTVSSDFAARDCRLIRQSTKSQTQTQADS